MNGSCLFGGGFGGSLEKVEGLGGFGGDGVGSFFEVVGDFEDAWGVGGQGGDLFRRVLPVNRQTSWAAAAGPEVVVFGAVIIVEVKLGDAGFEELEGFVDADVFLRLGEVGVADVEADTDAVEVADVEDLEDVLGGGDLVLQVFDEETDAERVGEGLEVLNGGEGVFEGAGVPGVALLAKVKDAGGDGNLLGGLEGALDLVHGSDAVGFFGVDEVDVGGDVAGPLAGAAIREVDGLVERGGYTCVAEPGGDVADGGAVGVVEVVAGGEDLDGLDTIGGAGVVEGVKQAGVQALLEEDVGGEGRLHHFLGYSRGGFEMLE